MEIKLSQHNGIDIAEVSADMVLINDAQDALDIMANCSYQGASCIIMHEKQLAGHFFDLSSGLAGEVLQKFSNYRVRLAIVGDFSRFDSKSLKDFIFESNKHGRINFVGSQAEAIERLSK